MPIQSRANPQTQTIIIEDLIIQLTRKRVQNLSLRITREAQIRVTAPLRCPDGIIREFITTRIPWVKTKLQLIDPSEDIEFQNGEIHYILGKQYYLKNQTTTHKPSIQIQDNLLILNSKTSTFLSHKTKLLDSFYSSLTLSLIPELIAKYQPIIGVSIANFKVKKLKSKWGSCNIRTKEITINSNLLKKPIECLEMVIVHELVHLLEKGHNLRFYGFMDKYLPNWRTADKILKGKSTLIVTTESSFQSQSR
jgi:predicted metal-dependent hydrolase